MRETRPNLKIIELFSGIGAQMKGINNTHLFISEMIGTSDLDKEVVVSYAAIHCGLTKEMIENYGDYPSKEDMVKELTDKRLGYDFKKDKPYDWEKAMEQKKAKEQKRASGARRNKVKQITKEEIMSKYPTYNGFFGSPQYIRQQSDAYLKNFIKVVGQMRAKTAQKIMLWLRNNDRDTVLEALGELYYDDILRPVFDYDSFRKRISSTELLKFITENYTIGMWG